MPHFPSHTTKSEINEGVKIPIDDGPDGGEITKIGSFNQKLSSDINLEKYNGVAIWCDAFSVPFGYASLK
ncbi:MAG: DM13 domain-containing protein [Candidatus Paceibacteria bacterium]